MNSIADGASLLKINYLHVDAPPSTSNVDKHHILVKPIAEIIRNSNQMHTSTSSLLMNQTTEKVQCEMHPQSVQSNTVVSILCPAQIIPRQFQTEEFGRKIASMTQKTVERNTTTTDSTSSATPSGAKLSTVNHGNRSLVYREPVSTKDTAPSKICNQIGLIDLAKSISCENFQSISSAIGRDVDHCNSTNEKICVLSADLVSVPKFNSCALGSKQTVKGSILHLSKANKPVLQQKDNITTEILSNNQYPHEFIEWEEMCEPDQKLLLSSSKVQTMSDILSCQKRSRAKSAFISEGTVIESETTKINRTKSNEQLEIINIDSLPEKKDYLYNMYRSDCQKVLLEKGMLKKEHEVKTFAMASGSKNIQISNGQLSDINGPIRLLDKPSKHILASGVMHLARIHSQNAAIASLPLKDKKRKLQEDIESSETLVNLLENGDDKQIKRTYGRSNSFNVKSKMHFKVGNLGNQMRKISRKPIKIINHEQDWVTESVSKSNPADSSSGKCIEQLNNENDGHTQILEIEQCLSWNTLKTLGKLPNSHLIFQKNEFDTIEIDVLAMTKMKAMKQNRKDFPQLQPSMACGHSDAATCFDAIIQRLNGGNSNISCKGNEKKPHQYYSNEFKQIVGALVQNKVNNCQAITINDLKDALRETNMYDRTKNSSHFSWPRFIDYYNRKYSNEKRIQLAPPELFVNAIPKCPNTFEIGQKLEAIDPGDISSFCICTIVDKCGYRIKLRFDGYSTIYDFWVNADSMNIFPAGWCQKTGRELESSRRLMNNRNMQFDWEEYLRQTNTQPANRACFPNVNTAKTQMNPFKIGMKLEADDIKNTERIFVATIRDVIDSRVLVALDEMESCYNYWTDIRSPYIHPINFHREGNYSIVSPPRWRAAPFSWESYLRENRAEAVPKDAFHTRQPKAFTKGMALEIVDKKNPSLIRPATVTMAEDYHIRVLFIGWPEKYAYWVDDDSCDIFPPGYCKKTGHPIECPLDDFIYELPKSSCGILGCRGIGNGKRPDASNHTTLEECPYEDSNWSKTDDFRTHRIDRKHKTINTAFNIGAGPSRKVSINPAFEKVQVSLQPTLNPAELAAMSSKDVETFRRLQVSASFLLENRKALSELRDQWIDRLKPLKPVQLLAAAKNPLNWTKEEVAKFVSLLPNCSSLGSIFLENDIDGLAFLSLRQSDMIDIMGLSIGTSLKVFNRIVLLREECNTHYIHYL